MTDLLTEPVKIWLKESTAPPSELSIVQLAGDASARRYYRVIYGEKTWVLMCWEAFSAENYPFLSVQRHFSQCGVQVPQVIAFSESLGVMLLEDLGDLTLERKFWENANQETSESFYLKTLHELLKIHDKATYSDFKSTASVTKFDTAKFLWEMNYAKEHLLLGLLKIRLNESTLNELNSAFIGFCSILAEHSKVICHRDFHSRNVMIKRDQVYIIDFQDARLGPVQYDLVSLFKDSYVDMSDEFAERLMSYYLSHSLLSHSPGFSRDEFNHIYELQSVQRCFKACGSFASFMNMRQDKRYLKYLVPTLRRVLKSLAHFPEYAILSKVLTDAGALEKNYETMR